MPSKKNNIISWNDSFPKLKDSLFFLLATLFIVGNIIDMLTLSDDLANNIYLINGLFVVLVIAIIILFLSKIINLKQACFLIIYIFIVNMFISLLFNINQPDIEKLLLREMIIASVLIIPSGFLLNKNHILSIGIIIPLFFLLISQKQKFTFIYENSVILTLTFVSYLAWIYYLIYLLEKWYIEQQELMHKLEQRNDSLVKKSVELDKTNKTKDRLFSIIAHDLRNPFNSIHGFSDLIIRKGNNLETEKRERYIKLINQASEESINLLDNLFDWATSQTNDIHYNPIELIPESILERIKKSFKRSLAEKEITITIKHEDSLILYADSNMLNTILRNLVSNAIKFTPRSGSINITVKSILNYTLFSVTDTGIGMNNIDKENLFKSKLKIQSLGTEDEKGTGLGLIICEDFVKRHGGKIWVESEENKGTTFSFTIINKQ